MLLTSAERLVASKVSALVLSQFCPLFFNSLQPRWRLILGDGRGELVTAVFKSTLSYRPCVCVGL